MILAWIFIVLGIIGLVFVINFCVKMHNWEMRGYEETFQLFRDNKLGVVSNPQFMEFSNIENKMYHKGAYRAYQEINSIFKVG